MIKQLISIFIIVFFIVGVYNIFMSHTLPKGLIQDSVKAVIPTSTDSLIAGKQNTIVPVKDSLPQPVVSTGAISPDSIVNFAKTLIGTPYLYASTDPAHGFDCSGFITYVFNHYKIKVPRSSREFGNVGTTIPLAESKKGDLILFTGTDSTERNIGHMGIVLTNDTGHVTFIHSSSGRAHGVTISPLDKYYQGRFVKTIRLFK